jgi:hypothetical protein
VRRDRLQYVLVLALVAVAGFAGVKVLGRDAPAPAPAPRSPAFENVLAHALRGEPLTPEGAALAERLNPPASLGGTSYSVSPRHGTMSFSTLDGGRVTSPNVVVDLADPAVPVWTAGGVPVDPATLAIH